jgi:hypothetical protein
VSPWQYALWGAFGGFAVEAIQFYGAIRRTGDWPWKVKGEPGPLPLLVPVIIRVGVGFGLTWAAAATHQVSGPLVFVQKQRRWWWNAWREATATELYGFADSQEAASRAMYQAIERATPSPAVGRRHDEEQGPAAT